MNATLDCLKLRVVPINYVAPAICEFDFSGSALGELILPPLDSSGLPGLIWEQLGEGWRFSWPAYPGAICYTVYRANGDGSYTVIADCITTLYFVGTTDGCYRIEAITEGGATSTSEEVCVDGDGTTVSYNGLRIPFFSMPRGRFGAVSNYVFSGPAWEVTGSGRVQQPTWSVRLPADWPTGLRFNRTTGGFSGKPVRDPGFDQDLQYVGQAIFRAQNSSSWAERNGIEWRVDPQIRITSGPEITTSGPGEEFVVTLTATNVLGPTTWTTLDDPETWPDWFNLSSSGQLSVIPPTSDPYTFTAVVQDTGGAFSLASKNQREITLVGACAGSQNFAGDTTGAETWHRVADNGSQPAFYLSNVSNAVPFTVHEFSPPCTGEYTVELTGTGGWDTFLAIYAGAFDADFPLCGTIPFGTVPPGCYPLSTEYAPAVPMCDDPTGGVCVRANDDSEPGKSKITLTMTGGETYFLVATGFDDESFGAYTIAVTWG